MIASEDDARAFVAKRCSAEAFAVLESYVEHLRREAENQNLVSRNSLDAVWSRHIADSAQLLDHVPRGNANWLDLGSGAGLPGLVIAIMRPDIAVTLVEARRKRSAWLEYLCAKLAIRAPRIIGAKLETMLNERFDVISARAFAPLQRLLDLAGRFADERTIWLLPKGRSAVEELATLAPEAQKGFHVEPSITDDHAGILVGNYRVPERKS